MYRIIAANDINLTLNVIQGLMPLAKKEVQENIGSYKVELQKQTKKQLFFKIWKELRTDVKYEADPFGSELIKTPKTLFKDKAGDCEDYAIAVAAILQTLGYRPYFRVVSFSGLSYDHIYIVCNGYIIDPVSKTFNTEMKYKKKIDLRAA